MHFKGKVTNKKNRAFLGRILFGFCGLKKIEKKIKSGQV